MENATMFEHDEPSGVTMQAWYSADIDKARVTSSPGGITLDADGVRELRAELDAILAEMEDSDDA